MIPCAVGLSAADRRDQVRSLLPRPEPACPGREACEPAPRVEIRVKNIHWRKHRHNRQNLPCAGRILNLQIRSMTTRMRRLTATAHCAQSSTSIICGVHRHVSVAHGWYAKRARLGGAAMSAVHGARQEEKARSHLIGCDVTNGQAQQPPAQRPHGHQRHADRAQARNRTGA